jgi:hypothetical protein
MCGLCVCLCCTSSRVPTVLQGISYKGLSRDNKWPFAWSFSPQTHSLGLFAEQFDRCYNKASRLCWLLQGESSAKHDDVVVKDAFGIVRPLILRCSLSGAIAVGGGGGCCCFVARSKKMFWRSDSFLPLFPRWKEPCKTWVVACVQG